MSAPAVPPDPAPAAPQIPPGVVPLDQVQGIIVRGYELLASAHFVLLEITDAAAARGWLAGLAPQVTDATAKPVTSAVNVAFTWEGLKLLLQPARAEDLHGFSREFQEGMDTPHRQRVLGDTGVSEPAGWDWGNNGQPHHPHVLLLLYATDAAGIASLYAAQQEAFTRAGLYEVKRLETLRLPGRKEHFGFRDGIAQPFLAGVVKEPPPLEPPAPGNVLKAGEMLLGYRNEYDKLPVSPSVPAAGGGGSVDFGANGSYLVFRQLSQDVRTFWQFIDRATQDAALSPAAQAAARVKLATKMVGRWPSGAPLMLSPDQDDPALQDADVYGFGADDPLGVQCPIGAHTRRSNPRDSLEPGPGAGKLSAAESQRVTKLHRILRRGREYGPPVAASMDAADVLRSAPAANEPDRGLHFLCFNADIARQFEFVQQTWVNNPKFGGLYADSDPIMGLRRPTQLAVADTFTCQDTPLRRRFTGLPVFVRVRGGGYFFMPGIQAVRHLAGLPATLPPPQPDVEE